MPVCLITPEGLLNAPDSPYVKVLEDAGFDVVYPDDSTFTRGLFSEEETIKQLSVCDALIAGGEYVTNNVFEANPRLRVVARSGVGYDRVDIPGATKHKVAVTITPTANHECVAEHAIALMFAVARSIVVNDRVTRTGGWKVPLTHPLRGQTFGILGLGRIGRSIATRVKALRMNVVAHELFPDQAFVEENGIELVDFDTLLEKSDYLSIHCPLNEETQGLFNQATFAKMKSGSVLINTARGGLVVEDDLITALKSGHLRGAGLDVFQVEPAEQSNPLFEMDEVVVAPHIGGADWLSQLNMGIEAAECIVKLYRGEWPQGAVVNHELKDGWSW